MRYLLTLLLCSTAVFSQAVPAANSAVFSIDPSQRGTDLINMFKTLSGNPYNTFLSEVAIQTSSHGLLRNIKKITPASNSTILAINYIPAGTVAQVTIPILVEQIVEMIYSNNAITGGNFTPAISSGVLPFFSVNLSFRSADIQNMVALLKRTQSATVVSLKTTLNGPFYTAIPNGIIPNVQSISVLFNTLLLVTYNQPNAYVVVAPDQVIGINYSGPLL